MSELLLVLFLLVIPLLAVTTLLALAVAGAALWSANDARHRVQVLERAAATTPRAAPLPITPEPDTETPTEEVPVVPAAPDAERPVSVAPGPPPSPRWTLPSPERVAVWVASGLGGFLVLLASLFALAVAFDRGWLGPAPRVALGLAAGSMAWVAGAALRWRGLRLVGSGLGGGGLGAVYGALFAATSLYDLLSPTTAFVWMVAVTGVAMAEATRHRDRFLAHLGLIGGLLAPILVSTGENNPVGLFGYLTLLMAGSQLAAIRRGWWDLTLLAALGAFVLHVGWSATWYAADQAPIALIAVIALSAPFAFAAATRREGTLLLRLAALAALLGFTVAALPWMGPLDPVFRDPHTGLEVVRRFPGGALWAAIALAIVPSLAWLAARRRADLFTALVGTLSAGALASAAALAWGLHPDPPGWHLALGTLASVALAAMIFAWRGEAGRGAAPLPALLGWTAAGWLAVAAASGPLFATTAAGLCVLAVILALGTGVAWTHLATLLGVTALLTVGVARVEVLGAGWVIGPALLAYGALATLPVLSAGRGRAEAALVAALAPLLLYGPLHALWVHRLGDGLVGLLPLLLGAVALLGALVLVRAHRVHLGSGALAVFVGVALLGVTAAVPVQLHSQWLTVAWALQAAALVLLSRKLLHPLLRVAALLLAVVVSVRLLVNPWALAYGQAGGLPVLNWTLYTWGVPGLALLVAARAYPVRSRFEAWAPSALAVLAISVGFALVNVQVSHAFQDAGPIELGGSGLLQGMVRSLSWAAFGVAVLVAGLFSKGRVVRLVGFALVLLATAKVFAVDLWSLQGFVRVGSVLGLGVSLLVAAFLFERLVLRQPKRP